MGWADLAKLTQDANRTVFAEEATYDAPPGGAPVAIRCEFDAAAISLDMPDGVTVHTVGPRASLQLSELPGGVAEEGAILIVQGRAYQVLDPAPDGFGMVMVRLELV